jgi:RNA polymerase sigma-70 factor (ECF subfamily)
MRKEFKQMIMNNQGRIRYIASRYSHDGEFDDMYQEILLQLWRSFESFSGESKQETGVYKVALNTACTFVRAAVKQKEIKQSPLHQPMQVLQPTQESCQADILDHFMDRLSDTDASLLMMYLDGLSSDDSAKVLGISSNAVRSRIKRIKNEFETNYIGD